MGTGCYGPPKLYYFYYFAIYFLIILIIFLLFKRCITCVCLACHAVCTRPTSLKRRSHAQTRRDQSHIFCFQSHFCTQRTRLAKNPIQTLTPKSFLDSPHHLSYLHNFFSLTYPLPSQPSHLFINHSLHPLHHQPKYSSALKLRSYRHHYNFIYHHLNQDFRSQPIYVPPWKPTPHSYPLLRSYPKRKSSHCIPSGKFPLHIAPCH